MNMRMRMRERLQSETDEERQARLADMSIRNNVRTQNEDPIQPDVHLNSLHFMLI